MLINCYAAVYNVDGEEECSERRVEVRRLKNEWDGEYLLFQSIL